MNQADLKSEIVRVLLVEDNPDDIDLLSEMLTEVTSIRINLTHVERLSEALSRLSEEHFDVILLDLSLQDSRGLDSLNKVYSQSPETPIVVLTRLDDEVFAVQTVQKGSQDYLVKGQIDGQSLLRSIRHAIERKRVERELRASEDQFRDLYQEAPLAYFSVGIDGRIQMANRHAVELLGYSLDDLIGRPVFDLYADTSSGKEKAQKLLLKFGTGEEIRDEEMEMRRVDGRSVWINLTVRPVRDTEGEVVASRSMVVDITERKRMEEELRKSHNTLELRVQERTAELSRTNETLEKEITERVRAETELGQTAQALREKTMILESILDCMGEGVVVSDENGQFLIFNSAAEQIVGIGATDTNPDEWPQTYGAFLPDTTTPIPVDEQPLVKAIQGEEIDQLKLFLRNLQNPEGVFVSATGRPLRDGEGNIKGGIVAFHDITEKVRMEEQINESLKEKEILLKEIHHRVKNNLQIVSSLLSLQASNIKDRQTFEEAIRESESRIRSMALIHEELYQSTDLARIDFSEYIRNLTNHLFQSYGVNLGVISLNINAEDVSLGIDTAIPCGLIINELVSNSLKHAFTDGREGKIGITISTTSDHQFTLIVDDNGVSFPKGVDFRNTQSLGLKLVNMLVKQLEGTIELDKSSGTRFRITF